MSAEFVPFDWIKRTFEQGPEDGWFYIAPVGLSCFDQQLELILGQRQRGSLLEQAAVEMLHILLQGR